MTENAKETPKNPRGRPRAARPKERVSFRVPLEVFEIYDDEQRRGGAKATKEMERVVTLHAQMIIRHRKIAASQNQATLSRDGRHPVHD